MQQRTLVRLAVRGASRASVAGALLLASSFAAPSVAWAQNNGNNGPGNGPGARAQAAKDSGVDKKAAKDKDRKPPMQGKAPVRVPWRGTAFGWSHSATTSALGIGDDYQSSAFQQYTQTFSLGLNYFLIDQKFWSFALTTGPSVSVELTNSGITTTEREPQFSDLNLGSVFRFRLPYKSKSLATGIVANATLLFPTSPASSAAGTYLTTSPRLVVWQALPGIPKKYSSHLNSWVVGISTRWDHRFGAATTAVNDDLQRPRQDALGNTVASDQLTFNGIASDTLRAVGFLFVSENLGSTTLNASAAVGIASRFLPEFEGAANGCDVQLQTGCVEAGSEADVRRVQNSSIFAVSASWFPMAEWGVNMSYAHVASQLATDGTRRNLFYGPSAQFSAGLVLSIDAIYESIRGPRRKNPFVLVAKNKQPAQQRTAPAQQRTAPAQQRTAPAREAAPKGLAPYRF